MKTEKEMGLEVGKRAFRALAVFLVLVTVAGRAEGRVLTFDDVRVGWGSIWDGYGGFDWDVFQVCQRSEGDTRGYSTGVVSGEYAAWNDGGMTATLNDGAFDFYGAYFSAAWSYDLDITVVGYRDGMWQYSKTVEGASRSGPTWVDFGWEGVDELVFSTPGGLGYQFVMDDFTIDIGTLTWDGLGDGQWGQSRWIGATPPLFPDSNTIAVLNTNNTVTVAQDREAHKLEVTNGGVSISAGRSLSVHRDVNVTPGALVTLGNGATLAAGDGGSIASVAITGNARINTGGNLAVTSFADDGVTHGTFTKGGAGALFLDNSAGSGVVGGVTTFRVEEGALKSIGADPLGGATAVELAGGTLLVETDVVTGYQSGLYFGVLPGSFNKIDSNPRTSVTIDLAETEGAIPEQTTHAFTGEFYDADGHVSFQESIDDNAYLLIDDTIVALDDTRWGTSTQSGNLALAPGWHKFDLRLGNAGGAGGRSGSPAGLFGFAYDPNGGSPWLHPPGSLFRAPILASIDMRGTSITVSAHSGLDAISSGSAAFGPLTMTGGTLTTAGALGGISFEGTTISAGTVGFETMVDTRPGPVDANGATINKSGPADLILDEGASDFSGATFNVQAGRLVAVHHSNPLAGAGVNLNGGELVLSSGTGGNVAYDNAVTVNANSTLTAGPAGGGVSGPLTVTLGSGTNGVTLNTGSVELKSTGGYVLNVAGRLSGPGGVAVNQGTVILSNTANSMGALEANGGAVSTAGNEVTITNRLKLDDVNYAISNGNTFEARGTDLRSGVDLTLSSGTLSVTGPGGLPADGLLAHWKFDETYGTTAFEETGSYNAQVYTSNSSPNWVYDPVRGRVLDFDRSYQTWVDVPSMGSNLDAVSFAMWIHPQATPGSFDALLNNDGWSAGTAHFAIGSSNAPGPYYVQVDVHSGGGKKIMTNPLVQGEWRHVIYTYQSNGTVEFYFDGQPDSSHGGIPNQQIVMGGRSIGQWNSQRWVEAMLDDVMIYGRALTAEEAKDVYDASSSHIYQQNFVDAPNTNILVTADSEIAAQVDDVALGNIEIRGGGTTLTLSNASYSFHDVVGAHGAAVVGNLSVSGALAAGNSAGTLSINGDLVMRDNSMYEYEGGDLIAVSGDLQLDADWGLKLLDSNIVAGGSLTLFTFGTYDDGMFGAASIDAQALIDAAVIDQAQADALYINTDGQEIVLYGLTAVELWLTWDGLGDGNWGEARWTGDTPPDFPGSTTHAVVTTNTVTVAAERSALSLTVESGGVAIDSAGALNVIDSVNVAAGAALNVTGTLDSPSLTTAGATTFAPGSGGDIATINVTGGICIMSSPTVTQLTVSDGELIANDNGLGDTLSLVDTLSVTGGMVTSAARLNAATVNVSGGVVNTAGTGDNVGNLGVSGGVVNSSAIVRAATLAVSNGSVTAAGASVTDMTLSGGEFRTSANVDVSGTFDFSGGMLTAAGPVVVSAGKMKVSGTPDLNVTNAGVGDLTINAGGSPVDAFSYYTFDGTTADSGTLSNFWGTMIGGAGYGAGVVGEGLSLSGIGQYFDTYQDTPYDFQGGTVSFSMWAKLDGDDWNDTWETLIAKGEGQTWRLGRNGNTYTDISYGYNWINAMADITDNEWHHFVVTHTGGDSELFFDGESIGTRSGASISDNRASSLRIGSNPEAGGREFGGMIDEVLIYDRLLGQDEVDALYDAGIAGSYQTSYGALTMADDTHLTLTGPRGPGAGEASFESITAGDGATISGEITVRGTLAVGSSRGTLEIFGSLTMDETSTYK